MRYLIAFIIPLIFMFIPVELANALQEIPPPLLPGPDQAPIDGGLGLLAAAGGLYAYKKLRKDQKQN